MAQTRFLTIRLLLLLSMFGTGFPAIASLESVPYPGFGFTGDLVVRDTQTNLEWRRFADTLGASSTYIESELGSGGRFDGWRKATTTEVGGLLNNLDHSSYPAIKASYGNFFSLFGFTWYTGGDQYSYVRLSEGATGVMVDLWFNPSAPPLTPAGQSRIGFLALPDPDSRVAHWLVREATPVPIPSAIWLIVSALGFSSLCSAKFVTQPTNRCLRSLE